MALSRKFIWVEINRDVVPAICKRFHVNAYPSLILLGSAREKIHRFSGFKKPEAFAAQLREGLRRYDLYRRGKEWDEPLPRPRSLCEEGTLESFPAPSEKGPSGLAFLKDKAWIAQEGELAQFDLETGKVLKRFQIPRFVRDLCTDGKVLYGMEYGWTAGDPIHVIDPASGKSIRRIVTRTNRGKGAKGAVGIAWRDGKLYLLAGMRGTIHEVDPRSGAVTRVIQTAQRWLSGLDFDGRFFVAGSRTALYWIDPVSGATVRTLKMNYPLRVVAWRLGSYYLMEQAIFGFDKQNRRVRTFPKRVLVHKLILAR